MQVVIVILVLGVILGLVFAINSRNKRDLLEQGKIIERKTEFFRQAHLFTTKIQSISDIGNAINQTVLNEEKISFEPRYDQGIIVFHNQKAFGTFAAALRTLGKDDEGMHQYNFQVEAWRERDNSITRQDIFGANVLLTSIEKAMLQLDPDTKVDSAKFKTKTKRSLL